MAYYNRDFNQQPQNLQFYSSSYNDVSGHTTPSQAGYGGYASGNMSTASTYPPSYSSGSASFGASNVSGRMGEQGGLRTGLLAALGTEGYEGEPGLMEELGVNFGHIRTKVRAITPLHSVPRITRQTLTLWI